jgi:hypothetical protein
MDGLAMVALIGLVVMVAGGRSLGGGAPKQPASKSGAGPAPSEAATITKEVTGAVTSALGSLGNILGKGGSSQGTGAQKGGAGSTMGFGGGGGGGGGTGGLFGGSSSSPTYGSGTGLPFYEDMYSNAGATDLQGGGDDPFKLGSNGQTSSENAYEQAQLDALGGPVAVSDSGALSGDTSYAMYGDSANMSGTTANEFDTGTLDGWDGPSGDDFAGSDEGLV